MPVRFYRRSTGLIFYSFHVFGIRIRRSTGVKIPAAYWSVKSARVKDGHPDAAKINLFLTEIVQRSQAAKIHFTTTFQRPGRDEFLDMVFPAIGPARNVFDKYDEFVQSKAKRLTPDSLKVYHSARICLAKFRPDLTTINSRVMDEFTNWLLDQDFSPNYIVKMAGSIALFAKWLGVKIDQKVRVNKRPGDSVSVSLDELELIRNCPDLPAHLQATRDIFLFACWTGLRYSDVKLFDKSFIQTVDGTQCLIFYAKKTGNKSVIPIFPVVQEILDRHGGNLPRRPSSQKFNDSLKDLCRLSGLTYQVQLTRLKGTRKESFTSQKYQVITSHSARRSFVTNMRSLGLAPNQISPMTGHTQQRVMEIYDKTTPETNALKVVEKLRDSLPGEGKK